MDSGRLSEYALARNLGANRTTIGPSGGNSNTDGDSSSDSSGDRDH